MAATYITVSTDTPSSQRTAEITAIVVGDQVDVVDILGRPARGIIFTTTDAADSISYKLNHKETLLKRRADSQGDVSAWHNTAVTFWNSGNATTFTSVGLTLQTVEGLKISSFEITAMTLSVGTTITAVVW